MSSLAPVVGSWKTSSSAARPPSVDQLVDHLDRIWV
jgi:hypothetical protein